MLTGCEAEGRLMPGALALCLAAGRASKSRTSVRPPDGDVVVDALDVVGVRKAGTELTEPLVGEAIESDQCTHVE